MASHRLLQNKETTSHLPSSIQRTIKHVSERLSHRPKLVSIFEHCFPNAIQTTTKIMDDGTTFVFTGDIPALWLRDSAEQILPYIFLAKDGDVKQIIGGLIRRHMFYINKDPYANAFNETDNGWHWDANDQTDMSDWVWERKYELDSLCFSIRLAYLYWRQTDSVDIFDNQCKRALRKILDVWNTEQRHFEHSSYRFMRENCPDIDTLRNNGKGMPVNFTGMTWSGFRPSDDACEFHFNIPSNLFAVVALRYMREILEEVYHDRSMAAEAFNLEKDIEYGVYHYGVYKHPKYGDIFVYETDGFGNHVLMDDAGTPSLLSLPYLGYRSADDPIYQNTRHFVLSKENPYYVEGKVAKGMGSPHTPPGYVWHLGLTMQALTSTDEQEIQELLTMLEATDANTGFMHEGFLADDPKIYTREWFAWSNSQYAYLILQLLEKGML